jgi:3-(3-hydroxy-phenyl)propionate hydroxylase
VHYDLGDGHPLLGRRMPDLDLRTGRGACRVYELLHSGRGLLLDLSGAEALAGPLPGRVSLVAATTDGPWELPGAGPVDAPSGVLVRPDGHVAWVGEGDRRGLDDALGTWFAAPASVRAA